MVSRGALNAFGVIAAFIIGGLVFTYFRNTVDEQITHKWMANNQPIEPIQPIQPNKASNFQSYKSNIATKQEGPIKETSDDSDMPILKNLRKEGVAEQLAGHDIAKMSANQRSLTFHSILDNTDTVCHRKLRMGAMGDGGWEICDDIDVRPRGRPCVVYSFGINNDFTFDDDTAASYGCHVYAFDPSMKQNTYNRSSLVHFYKIGLSGKTEVSRQGWKLYTFSDIRKLLGHENTKIDVVKMDIENAEWSSLREMITSGEMKKFKQFLVEFHSGGFNQQGLQLIKDIEIQGFKKFYVHKNPACKTNVKGFPGKRTNCYELHYVRRP